MSENPEAIHYTVQLNHVVHGYDGKRVLNDLTLNVRRGEFVTFVGPSGCGKSTLLRLLLRAEQPQTGSVHIDGKEKTRPDRDCGIVYQRFSVFPHLTVLENVAFGLLLEKSSILERTLQFPGFRRHTKEWHLQAREFINRVGLTESADKYPHQLSGGMQQRVAIAQALIMQPEVLLLDEPFSALDPWTREQLQLYLIELWQKEHMTVFFVTHDLEEAIYLGTRIIVLSPYYRTETGAGVGSKIVTDLPIVEPHPRALQFKTSKMLNDMQWRIRQIAFDHKADSPLVHENYFALEHPDSVHEIRREAVRTP